MTDYRQNIGTHFVNDRSGLYSFVRDSRIPHGTFDPYPRLTQSMALYLVAAVIGVVLLIAWGAAA